MAGTSDVVIARRGGADPRRTQVSGAAASWELNQAGVFSGMIPASELANASYDFGTDLRGYWLEYAHPTAGPWGGVISTTRATPDGLELGGEQFHTLFRKRLVTLLGEKQEPYVATAGALMRQIVNLASRAGDLYVTVGRIDDGGEPVGVEWQDSDCYDECIPTIADDLGNYWKVDAGRVLSFGRTPGIDRSGTVRLVYGRHVATYNSTLDLWSAENYLVGRGKESRFVTDKKTGKKKKTATRFSVVEQSAASVALYGPLMGVRAFGGSNSSTAVRRKLQAILAVTATPRAIVTLTLVDIDDCFGWFAEGDVVTVELPTSPAGTLRLRILSRALNAEGTLTVAGEIV